MGLLTYRMVAPETYYRSTACIETYHAWRYQATDFGSVALSNYAVQTMAYVGNQGRCENIQNCSDGAETSAGIRNGAVGRHRSAGADAEGDRGAALPGDARDHA